MKTICTIFLIAATVAHCLVAAVASNNSDNDWGCGTETHAPRCYCAGIPSKKNESLAVAVTNRVGSPTSSELFTSSLLNRNCDVSQPNTHTDIATINACEDYCLSECGEGAGSYFSCFPKDDIPQKFCVREETEDTICTCSCEHSVEVPKDIFYGFQCGAFCSREDVCGRGSGFAATCRDLTSSGSVPTSMNSKALFLGATVAGAAGALVLLV